MEFRRHAVSAVTISWIVVTGCSASHQPADSPQAGAQPAAVGPSTWTAGVVDQPRPGAPTATLVAVRTGTHEGFDRVVFEFDRQVPGYHVEYIDRPVRQCGSGDVTQVMGDGWLEVRMFPAKTHTDDGRPTVTERERFTKLPVLSELEVTCDFEAVVTWVAGVESPNRYQVRELNNPPRLVVDIAVHSSAESGVRQ